MSRMPRKLCESGYYHVMNRGIDKQDIFGNEQDMQKYLLCMSDSVNNYRVKIIAYCLMSNHTHLLIFDDSYKLPRFMQSLNTKYARYFNNKYERVGPLFQDRYKTELIKDERQLLATYRYIINNPYKAGICKPWEYRWNSYHCYGEKSSLLDTSFIEDKIGDKYSHKKFIESYHDEHFMDISYSRYDDDYAGEIIRKYLNLDNGLEISKLNKEHRDKCIVFLKNKGLHNKQIHRITGVSIDAVKKVKGDGGRS